MLKADGPPLDAPAEPILCREFPIQGGDVERAGDVSMQVRQLLLAQGVPPPLVRRAAIACFEAELNVVMYARRGQMRLTLFRDRIKVEVEDSGPGILDIEMALREGFSTASPVFRELGFGAGMGLPNIRSMVDQFSLMSEPGSGTALWFDVLIPPPAGEAEGDGEK